MKISVLKKLIKVSWIKTLYFNLHYLPFKQAIKLPILLYNVKLIKCKGSIRIDTEIKTGMIQLGELKVLIYHKSTLIWENNGGEIVFKGKCTIGNSSAISVGKTGYIEFGNDFFASENMKLISFYYIKFSEHARIGWETIIMDTSFHAVKNINGDFIGRPFGEIIIGKNNWIPTRCTVLAGTKTPDFCIFGSGSILNKDYSKNPTHILMARNPLQIKKTDIWRDMDDDAVIFKNHKNIDL